MKKLGFLIMTLFATATFTSCNEQAGPEGESDRVIIQEDENDPDRVGEDNNQTNEDEGNSINFDVESNEDGDVSGGVEGDIDLNNDDQDNQ